MGKHGECLEVSLYKAQSKIEKNEEKSILEHRRQEKIKTR
jgi:hypothetical protein